MLQVAKKPSVTRTHGDLSAPAVPARQHRDGDQDERRTEPEAAEVREPAGGNSTARIAIRAAMTIAPPAKMREAPAARAIPQPTLR